MQVIYYAIFPQSVNKRFLKSIIDSFRLCSMIPALKDLLCVKLQKHDSFFQLW